LPVYTSFAGRYADSPRALHEALADRPDLSHTWLSDPTGRYERSPTTTAGRLRFRPPDISRFYAVEVDVDSDLVRADERLLATGPA
jgi:hypothetical protein